MQIEYDVLSSIFHNRFVERRTKLLVLHDHYRPNLMSEEETISYLRSHFRKMDTETLYDFINKSSEQGIVESLFELNTPYIILTHEDAESIFSNGGWEEFYEKYPGSQGTISVSRVGFNTEQTQALACVGTQHHWRVGRGSYFLVEKFKDKWQVKRSAGVWRS